MLLMQAQPGGLVCRTTYIQHTPRPYQQGTLCGTRQLHCGKQEEKVDEAQQHACVSPTRGIVGIPLDHQRSAAAGQAATHTPWTTTTATTLTKVQTHNHSNGGPPGGIGPSNQFSPRRTTDSDTHTSCSKIAVVVPLLQQNCSCINPLGCLEPSWHSVWLSLHKGAPTALPAEA